MHDDAWRWNAPSLRCRYGLFNCSAASVFVPNCELKLRLVFFLSFLRVPCTAGGNLLARFCHFFSSRSHVNINNRDRRAAKKKKKSDVRKAT